MGIGDQIVFLYGMRQFAVLAAVFVGASVIIGMYFSSGFSLGGWFTAVALLLFAIAGRSAALRESWESRAAG